MSFWWKINILSLDLVIFSWENIHQTWLLQGTSENRKSDGISYDKLCIFGSFFFFKEHVFQSRQQGLEFWELVGPNNKLEDIFLVEEIKKWCDFSLVSDML